jgi:RimJ/RimL family protein N-acetyltransferase
MRVRGPSGKAVASPARIERTEPIRTERLDLTPLRVEDAPEVVAVLADPHLYAVIGGAPPTLDELRARYEHQVRGGSADGRETWLNWIVRPHPGREAVGFVQATVTDGGADIAWVIGVPWQRRGYATEAARGLVAWLAERGVTSITAHVEDGHRPSEAVAERIGLVRTESVEDGEVVWARPASS